MPMTFSLLGKALLGRVPVRALRFALLEQLHYLGNTGNRTFEFERLFLEYQDPWNYRDSLYEQDKYQHTLTCALNWRRSSETALEVGCSIGVFSRLLATCFDKVTAIDVSKEALSTAAEENHGIHNIRFVHGDLRSIDLGQDKYNIVVCAEVLYYIPKGDAHKVCQQLDRYLTPDGMIVMVTGVREGDPDEFFFDEWEQVLCAEFKRVFKEIIQHPQRPYKILVFAR